MWTNVGRKKKLWYYTFSNLTHTTLHVPQISYLVSAVWCHSNWTPFRCWAILQNVPWSIALSHPVSLPVFCVNTGARTRVTWSATFAFTLVIGHTVVLFVIKVLLSKTIWSDILHNTRKPTFLETDENSFLYRNILFITRIQRKKKKTPFFF